LTRRLRAERAAARRAALAASRGFTLVELVVVIVILGILAAVALPRFVNLAREARIAKLEAARGSVGAAAALANSVTATRGIAPSDPIDMAGATVTMRFSFPTADVNGIIVAAGLSSREYTFETGNGADPPNTIRVKVPGAPDINTCFFSYTSPLAQGDTPVITGTTPASTSGC
jgi:MSHA pilin protein MshA